MDTSMQALAFSLLQRRTIPAPHRNGRVSCPDANARPFETVQNVVERSNVASKKRYEPRPRTLNCGTRARRPFEFVLKALEDVNADGAFADAAKTRCRKKAILKPRLRFERGYSGLRRGRGFLAPRAPQDREQTRGVR